MINIIFGLDTTVLPAGISRLQKTWVKFISYHAKDVAVLNAVNIGPGSGGKCLKIRPCHYNGKDYLLCDEL
jgi:hypothetical protein